MSKQNDDGPPAAKQEAQDVNLEGVDRTGMGYDRFFFFAFLAVQGAYAILAGYAIQQMIFDWEEQTEFTGSLEDFGKDLDDANADVQVEAVTGETKTIFVFSTLAAFGINALLIFAMRMPSVARIFVWLTPALFVAGLLLQAAVMISQSEWVGAAVDGGMALLFVFILYLMRDRFELAKFTLVSTAMIVKEHTSILLVTFALLMIQLVLALINIFATVGVFLRFQPAHKECNEGVYCSASVTVAGCVFSVWAHLWLASTISNLAVVTLAGGPFSSHYFCPAQTKGEWTTEPVKSWKAFGKAFRCSLGATAFGSFLVGLIHFIHDLFAGLVSAGGEWALCVCYLCLCALSILEKLAQTFNKYVFIYIAIGELHSKRAQMESKDTNKTLIPAFRMTFLEGAKHTMNFIVRRPSKKELYKDGNQGEPKREAMMRYIRCHGIAVLINDDISQSALTMGCIASGVISGGVALALVYMFGGAVNDHWYDWAVVVYAFILGLCLGLVFSTAMGVGISTLFVCMSEDIRLLKYLNEEFSNWIENHKTYKEMFDFLVKKAKGKDIEEDGSYHDEKNTASLAERAEERK